MRHIDLRAERARLRYLGSDFEDVHSEIRSLNLSPGTQARQQLTSTIVAINELGLRAMERLAALDGSQYTAVPGSRPALETLASVISAAGAAAAQVARALEANPLESAPFTGPPADETTLREARHQHALPAMTRHLAHAAHHLAQAHTSCYSLAVGISRHLQQGKRLHVTAEGHRPLVQHQHTRPPNQAPAAAAPATHPAAGRTH